MSRLIHVGAVGRRRVGERLHEAWDAWDQRCDDLEWFNERVSRAYREMWQKGWPSWGRALLLAPFAFLALTGLVVGAMAARLLALVAAATLLVVQAVALAAPVVAVAWALATLVPDGTAAAPAATTPCDPSYPAFCVALSAEDLDCPGRGTPPYAPRTNFPVRGYDVHDLDRDDDGVGCEDPSNGRP